MVNESPLRTQTPVTPRRPCVSDAYPSSPFRYISSPLRFPGHRLRLRNQVRNRASVATFRRAQIDETPSAPRGVSGISESVFRVNQRAAFHSPSEGAIFSMDPFDDTEDGATPTPPRDSSQGGAPINPDWSPFTRKIAAATRSNATGRDVIYQKDLAHGYQSICTSQHTQGRKEQPHTPAFCNINVKNDIMIQTFNPRDLWTNALLWLHVESLTAWGGLTEAQFQLFCVQCWDCRRYLSKASAEFHVCPVSLRAPAHSVILNELPSNVDKGLFTTLKARFCGVKVPGLTLEELELYFVQCVDCKKVMTRETSSFHDDSFPCPPHFS